MAVPTKKRRSAQMVTELGHMTACDSPWYATLDAKCELQLDDDGKLRETVPASPQDPRLVCRALVKMAIGWLARIELADVFAERINTARRFARFNHPKIKWWYLEKIDRERMKESLNDGIEENQGAVVLKTVHLDSVPAYFYLKYYFLEILTPIEPHFGIEAVLQHPDLPADLTEGADLHHV